MRNCPDCNAQLEDRAIFCDNCGLKLSPAVSPPPPAASPTPASAQVSPFVATPDEPPAQFNTAAPGTCSVCGSSNVPGEMFCQNCGVQLAPVVSSPPPPPSPVAEFTSPPGPAVQVASVTPPAVVEPWAGSTVGNHAAKPPEPVKEVLSRNCPNCGAANNAEELYCQNCGLQLDVVQAGSQPVAVPAAPPSQPAPSALSSPPAPPSPPAAVIPEPPVVSSPPAAVTSAPPAVSSPPSTGQAASSAADDRFSTAPLNEKAVLAGGMYITGKLVVRATKAEINLPSAKTELTIGRSDPVRGVFPDVDLTSHGGDTGGVSRLHARLILQGEQLHIEDLNSTNYTFLNRQRLQPEQRYPVKSGDEIRLGLVILEYL